MATDNSNSDHPDSAGKPLSAAAHKRLQTYFEYGQDKHAAKDYDYAHTMFAQCTVADPANLVYVEAMLNNLTEKYKSKRKKAKVRSHRNAFKKAKGERDWKAAISEGVELLKENPWDLATLRGMAEISAEMRQALDDERFNEIELRYLRTALDGNAKDIDLNRHCAESLVRMGQFDQAIACWHRLEELIPGKGEAPERISELTVLKNLQASGMLDEETKPGAEAPVSRPTSTQASSPQDADPEVTATAPEARLQQTIVDNPTDVDGYLALAKLHESRNELQEAEGILRRALSASGNDLKVRERLEAVQVRRARQQLASAKKQFAQRKDQDSQQLMARMKEELNRLELGIYQSRCERYPDELGFRYELAIRLKRSKNYAEACKYFEEAAANQKLTASSRLQQGECLQQMHKYQEAMQRYQQAAKLSQSAEFGDLGKLALYRAGALAMGLKNWILARDMLDKLMKIDPKYLDVAARLDKLNKMEQTQ